MITASWVRYVKRPQLPAIGKGKSEPLAKSCGDEPESCSPVAEKVAMTLGPVNLGVNKWSQFFRRLSWFLRDFTLPIILIVLAQWLAAGSAERDRRREHLERDQEEEKQIAHILLPKVMRLAGHYYLPMTLHSMNFVTDSASGRTSPKKLAFHMFSFFHVARALKEKEGGIFFKDNDAEQMFVKANKIIRAFVVEAVGDRDDETQFTACLNDLDKWLPAGEKRWPRISERPADVPKGWTDLQNRLEDLQRSNGAKFQAIRFLFYILAATIRYEVNAPYSYWYISSRAENPRAENLFRLDNPVAAAAPSNKVFGDDYAKDLADFLNLLSRYRQGKEKSSK